MPIPLLPLALGLAGGAVKHFAVDKPAASKNRRMQAAIARYSPWTGMKPDVSSLRDPSLFGSLLQGGTAGLML